mmetsp:Transcript_20127/g.34692  ORF Transcript_20127/g.34692 Transcript_20127/m.34692 type:complete len:364 (+) Transcript_20127:119-1210(+)
MDKCCFVLSSWVGTTQATAASTRSISSKKCPATCKPSSKSAIKMSTQDEITEKLGISNTWPADALRDYMESEGFKKHEATIAMDFAAMEATEEEKSKYPRTNKVRCADAMQFFRFREGDWASWRVTHHLAFRRSETGESNISMECLEADDERIVELCGLHEVDPKKAIGGCYVTWKANMSWDQEGENHEGSTVFALVPEEGSNGRRGKILRDRGYAEIVQIAGDFYMDDEDALNLVTPYDGGEVIELFTFDGPDIVNRVSTVKRFGGFATATYATERRKGTIPPKTSIKVKDEDISTFDLVVEGVNPDDPMKGRGMYGARARMFGNQAAAQGPPSMRSAFSSGWTNNAAAPPSNESAPKAPES